MKGIGLFVLCLAALLSGCATTESGPGLSLYDAIEASADKIAAELPAGSRVVIAAFDSENDNLSDFIMDELTGALFDRGIEVADRQNLEYVYRELGFQMTPDVSDESAMSIGRFLGAQLVISGVLQNTGRVYRYRTRAVYVQESTRASDTRHTVRNDEETRELVRALAGQTVTARSARYGEAETDGNTAPRSQTAGTFFDRGLLFFHRHDYDTAIADFNEAIRLDPRYASAYYRRGNAYGRINDYDRAIMDYTQVIRLEPDNAYAYLGRGDAYYQKEDFYRAIGDYTQAIRIDPNFAGAYQVRGNAYGMINDYDNEIADYEVVLRIDPNRGYLEGVNWLLENARARQAARGY